jgi:hypothetical protein
MFTNNEGQTTSKEAALARYGINPGVDNYTPPDTADVQYSLDGGQRNTILSKLSTFNPYASPVSTPDQPKVTKKDDSPLVAIAIVGAVGVAALFLGNALKG